MVDNLTILAVVLGVLAAYMLGRVNERERLWGRPARNRRLINDVKAIAKAKRVGRGRRRG